MTYEDRTDLDLLAAYNAVTDELQRRHPHLRFAMGTAEHAGETKDARREYIRQKEHGRATAAVRKETTAHRDRQIAAFALDAARKSDELADNPKQLPRYVLMMWRPEWGRHLATSTVARILREQHVASRLKDL